MLESIQNFTDFTLQKSIAIQSLAKQKLLVRWLKKGVILIFELLNYLFFLLCIICLFWLWSYNPFVATEQVAEGVTATTEINIEAFNTLKSFVRFFLFLLSLFFLAGGLFLRSIRKRNNILQGCFKIAGEITERAKSFKDKQNTSIQSM
ncbi:MAG: hypothetical protein HY960_10555 [Ignavibacteriae bacterium]|nr:hypothetical protein [Ignavibacteriota bacterium]